MTTAKCEFCGRFGATKGKWIDPRGMHYGLKAYTLELCPRCWDEQNAWAELLGAEIKQITLRSEYMDGWDHALIDPGKRAMFAIDHNADWLAGFDDCIAGKPLPAWYAEWKASQPVRVP